LILAIEVVFVRVSTDQVWSQSYVIFLL